MVPAGTPRSAGMPGVTYSNHVAIDHDSPTPLYVQLAALLRGQIEDGTLTGRMPSVKTLSQEHGVSHITAEKALSVLKEDGIVLSVIGKGTFVTRPVDSRVHASLAAADFTRADWTSSPASTHARRAPLA